MVRQLTPNEVNLHATHAREPPGYATGLTRWQWRGIALRRSLRLLVVCAGFTTLCSKVPADEAVHITMQTTRVRQVFEGLGA